MPPILEVHDLVKHYGDAPAVKGISFHIDEGEIFSLLGPNGAGKSTTINMLSTLFAPTSGEATIGGQSVTRNPMAVRQLIGVVRSACCGFGTSRGEACLAPTEA